MNYAGKFEAFFSHGQGADSPAHVVHGSSLHAHAPADAILVPDAQLLFNADFKRSGVDLILSEGERELVLHDYFKGEKRAPLASPDGAHLTGDIVNALAGAVQVGQAGVNAGAGQVIGHVTKLQGSATVVRNGVSIILHMGDNVEKGDVVQSGSDSTVGITFIDGTVFGLSSNARMVLNEMVYDPNGSSNSTLFSLVAGTISFVAGETAKHGDMKIDTPVATMGIRGTAVLVEIDFTVPGQGATPNAKFQVLVEPDGTTGSYILFDKATLQPIAVVNQAGQQINITNGVVSQTQNPLSPELQKLINDVFTLKFTDNTNPNPKTTVTQNDSVTPTFGPTIKTADATTATPLFLLVTPGSTLQQNSGPSGLDIGLVHILGTLDARMFDAFGQQTTSFAITELVGQTDGISGTVNFVDINAGDTPSVKVSYANTFSFHSNSKQSLNNLQQQEIQAIASQIKVVPAAGNNNNGSATFTFSLPDKALDFLSAGDTLTMNFVAEVDSNYGPANETKLINFTITITGTGNSGPVWTATATSDQLWGTASNWQDDAIPTANDDVLIMNDPQHGLTPSFPVTIAAPAAAKSLTLSDLGETPPELINESSLTIGGALNLENDSILHNLATISLGGLVEILNQSVLQNGGMLKLGQGGDFKDQSSITNTGTIEVAGGTLNVSVNIANSDGEGALGTIQVDAAAKMMLDAAAITGGSLTINGTLDSEESSSPTLGTFSVQGASALDGVTVSNSGLIDITGTLTLEHGTTVSNLISIAKVTVESDATLTLLDTSSISGGGLTNKSGGTIDLAGSALIKNVALDNFGAINVSGSGDTIDGGTLTNHGSGAIDVTGTLILDDGADVSGGTLANSGVLDIESATGAVLDGVSVDNTKGKIDVDTAVQPASKLVLKDATTITGGSLTIGALASLLEIAPGADATLASVGIANSGTIQVDGTASLTLAATSIAGPGTLNNSGTLENLLGDDTIAGAVTNTGAIEVKSGTLDLAGGLTGAGTVIVDDGATLELAGADAQTITFSGGNGTLQLDSTELPFNGTITGQSSTGGNFTIAGSGSISTTSGDGLDFKATGGTSGAPANVTLTPSGSISGGLNGILAVQNGVGDLTVDPTGDVTGLAGNGIEVRDSLTGFGNVTVDDAGRATGTGAGSVGLLAENLNASNNGALTITQTGGVSGDAYGIEALTHGDGNISVNAGGAVSASVQYGIRAASYGTGDITVTMGTGAVINAGSSGINAANLDTAIDASAESKIVVTAYGSITAGANANLSGSPASGIQAGYKGDDVTAPDAANPNVNGSVAVNNYANIISAERGITAYNYGNGDVTVNDEAGTTISTTSDLGIQAFSYGVGDVSVTTSAGDVIASGSTGIKAFDQASGVVGPADIAVAVTARGTIHSGADLDNGNAPAGITADYFGVAAENITATVTVDSYATIVAAAGSGISAFDNGFGSVSVTNEAGASITAPQVGIDASAVHGDVTITNDGSVSGETGVFAAAFNASNVLVTNNQDIAGTDAPGIDIELGAPGATGSGHVVNNAHGTVAATAGAAAVAVHENATGTFTLDNAGTIGTASIAPTTQAIFESGGDFVINNTGSINGTLELACGIFDNEGGGTWNLAGWSGFGFNSTTETGFTTLDNAGTINLLENASIVGSHGLSVTDSGTIDNLSGSGAFSGAAITVTATGLLEATGGMLTVDSASTIINTAGGTVEANGGTLVIDGTLSGNARIAGTSSIELGSASADAYASATITFDAHAAGTLKLDSSGTFSGTVVGLDDGDTIDLAGIADDGSVTFRYSGDASGGTLAVLRDGADVADIHLAGDYLGAHFVATTDKAGDTFITEVPGALSGLDSNGKAVEGQALTVSITDGGKGVTGAEYQWLLDGNPIEGATGASYTPTETDEGHNLSVSLTFVDANGAESSLVLAGTVQESPTENATIALSGSAVEGKAITASVTDPDAPASGITYVWTVNGTTVHQGLDAGGATYTPSEADEGQPLSVSVSFTDTHNNHETGTTSAGTVQESPTENATIALSGSAIEGKAITASVTDPDAPASGITYVWTVNGTTVHQGLDAGGATYTPSEADEGQPLSVSVSFTDTHNNHETGTTSAGTVQESPAENVSIALSGLVDGKPIDGQRITATIDEPDAPTNGIHYQWMIDGKPVNEATGASFTPKESQEGHLLSVSVSFTDTHHFAESGTATAGFVTDGDNDDAPHEITHQAPVIDTTQSKLVDNSDGLTTISGVQFTDTDPSAPTEIFTLVATAQNGSILPSASGSGTLQDIETALKSITYSPGANPPQTDKITLTVIDAFGDSDTVHFIFNEAGKGPDVILHSTSGTDVMFATGYHDTFVFAPSPSVNRDTVIGFTTGEDRIDLTQFKGITPTNIGQWLGDHAVQQGSDTLLTLDHNDSIILKNVLLSSLHTSDFIVSPHGGGGVS